MRNYAISAKITITLTIVAFTAVLITHYALKGNEAEFWCNVYLSIFGSGLLAVITSVIGYFYERRRTLEGFTYSTNKLLSILGKYDPNWDDEKKIDFFLEYNETDKSTWDIQLGDIYFICDPKWKHFEYVYKKIYKPILNLNESICRRVVHFRLHKEGNGTDKVVMHNFIAEIESLIIEIKTSEYENHDGKKTRLSFPYNKLVRNIHDELNGHYYEIMYGKKMAERNKSQWTK